MNEVSIVTQVTAIIAIVLSVVTLAWNVYKDGFRDRAKVKVTVGFRNSIGNGIHEKDIIVFTITNTGGKKVMITNVTMKGSKETSYVVTDDRIPAKLEPGDWHMTMLKDYGGMDLPLRRMSAHDSLGRSWHASRKEVKVINEKIVELASKGITKSHIDRT
jgi:hypothetical protein